MLISTRGRYALRVMIDLAEHNNGEYIPMKDVAARQSISLKYLEKILPVLTHANFITGVSGKGGGYKLTMSPESYRIGDILRLTEGRLVPVPCLDNPSDCSTDCRTHTMWDRLDVLINNYLDSVTIASLMKDEQNT